MVVSSGLKVKGNTMWQMHKSNELSSAMAEVSADSSGELTQIYTIVKRTKARTHKQAFQAYVNLVYAFIKLF